MYIPTQICSFIIPIYQFINIFDKYLLIIIINQFTNYYINIHYLIVTYFYILMFINNCISSHY